MKNNILKKFRFQTESNKFYTIIENDNFDTEDGVKLNPFLESDDLLDREIIVIKEDNLKDFINFNIRNTEFGLFLEVYLSNSTEIFIVDKSLNLDEIFSLIKKVSEFPCHFALKYIEQKYGLKKDYLFFSK